MRFFWPVEDWYRVTTIEINERRVQARRSLN
jgi:hypothetical protein